MAFQDEVKHYKLGTPANVALQKLKQKVQFQEVEEEMMMVMIIAMRMMNFRRGLEFLEKFITL